MATNDALYECQPTDVYGATLVELAERDPRVMVLEADLMRCSGTAPFQARFPERTIQAGIAEANMVGMAAGLAAVGMTPFCASFCTFASRRVYDQAFVSVALADLNVKIVGTQPGVLMEVNGATHMCFEDIALYRVMPNMTILCPGDAYELQAVVRWMAETKGPMYLQVIREVKPRLFAAGYRFTPGRAVTLCEGGDITLVSTSFMSDVARQAAGLLAGQGIRATHLHYPMVKPFDRETLVASAAQTGAVVTVENGNIIGGLGSAVAEALGEECPTRMKRIGIRDHFGEAASLGYLMTKFGLTPQHIAAAARELVKKK
jgi:transketolase